MIALKVTKKQFYPFSRKYSFEKATGGGISIPPSLFRVNEGKNRKPMPPKIPLKSLKKPRTFLKILKYSKKLAFHSGIS